MRPLGCLVPHTRVPLQHPDHRKKQPPRYWLGSSAEMGPAWPWSIITSMWVQSPTPFSLSSLLLPAPPKAAAASRSPNTSITLPCPSKVLTSWGSPWRSG